jgi:hypothetical protein
MNAHAGVVYGPSGPFEANKWPPSLDICRRILDVPDLSKYERHVCPDGCRYYFPNLADPKEHLRNCGGCCCCKCAVCNANRFERAQGGSWEARSKCYLLHDFIQQWLLNESWMAALLEAERTRQSPWYKSGEYHRIEDELKGMLGEKYEDMPVCVKHEDLSLNRL